MKLIVGRDEFVDKFLSYIGVSEYARDVTVQVPMDGVISFTEDVLAHVKDEDPFVHTRTKTAEMKQIIGFSGYAQTGKDSAAEALAELGWTRVAFADKLKEFVLKTDPSFYVAECPDEPLGYYFSLSAIVEAWGWEFAKTVPGVREFLQAVGEQARVFFGESVWVDLAKQKIWEADTHVCVTDVRYPNEVDAIRALGGRIVRVERPGYEPVNDHVSDTGVADLPYDLLLENDSDVDAWKEKIRKSFAGEKRQATMSVRTGGNTEP